MSAMAEMVRSGQGRDDFRLVRDLTRERGERFEKLETLAPLAREIANEAEVVSSLPRAHHFGHR